MSTWDDLAASHDTTAIARQLIEECTQLDIAALRDDPIDAIDRYTGIKLVYAPHADAGCGSGYYRPDPPTIYLHSSLYRRNAFTVLHELAHHLQRHHIEWGFHLMDIRDTNHRLRIEEMVCDRFAAEVLLPAERISDDALCHPADAMAGLYVNSNLSHSAVIQNVAVNLPPHARWILCVVDPCGVITTSQTSYSQHPPPKGVKHLELAAIAEEAADRPIRRALPNAFTYLTGATLTDMWAEACRDHENRYTFIAMRPARRFGISEVVDERFVCNNVSCNKELDSTKKLKQCPRCNEPKCPECNTCGCETGNNDRKCPICQCILTPYEVDHGHECPW